MFKALLVLPAVLVASMAEAQQQPVPQLKPTSTTGASPLPSTVKGARPSLQRWQVFNGATTCTQIGNMLSCDNGFKTNIR